MADSMTEMMQVPDIARYGLAIREFAHLPLKGV